MNETAKMTMATIGGAVMGAILTAILILTPTYYLATQCPEAIPVILGRPCIQVKVNCPCDQSCCPQNQQKSGAMPESK